ncbi:MAG: hypothetical protein ACYC2U_04825 [Candidatus Amoebophilus sp.]
MDQIKERSTASKKQSTKTQKATTTISTDRETLQKIKLIACLEGRLVKELMNASLKEYIRAYETTHGVIKLGLQQAKG